MFWRERAACIFSLAEVSCMSESGSDTENGTGVVAETIGPELGCGRTNRTGNGNVRKPIGPELWTWKNL